MHVFLKSQKAISIFDMSVEFSIFDSQTRVFTNFSFWYVTFSRVSIFDPKLFHEFFKFRMQRFHEFFSVCKNFNNLPKSWLPRVRFWRKMYIVINLTFLKITQNYFKFAPFSANSNFSSWIPEFVHFSTEQFYILRIWRRYNKIIDSILFHVEYDTSGIALKFSI